MTRPDPLAAYTRNAVERARLQARLQPRLSQHQGYDGWRRRHWWRIDLDGRPVASGRAFTGRAATRRKVRAYNAALKHRAFEAALKRRSAS